MVAKYRAEVEKPNKIDANQPPAGRDPLAWAKFALAMVRESHPGRRWALTRTLAYKIQAGAATSQDVAALYRLTRDTGWLRPGRDRAAILSIVASGRSFITTADAYDLVKALGRADHPVTQNLLRLPERLRSNAIGSALIASDPISDGHGGYLWDTKVFVSSNRGANVAISQVGHFPEPLEGVICAVDDALAVSIPWSSLRIRIAGDGVKGFESAARWAIADWGPYPAPSGASSNRWLTEVAHAVTDDEEEEDDDYDDYDDEEDEDEDEDEEEDEDDYDDEEEASHA